MNLTVLDFDSGTSCSYRNPDLFAGVDEPVIHVTAWDGQRLAGSIDGTLKYTSCGSFAPDPADREKVLSESSFELFLAMPFAP